MKNCITAIAYTTIIPAFEEPTVLWLNNKHSAILVYGKSMVLVQFAMIQDVHCITAFKGGIESAIAFEPSTVTQKFADDCNRLIAVYDSRTRTISMRYKSPGGGPHKYAVFLLVDQPISIMCTRIKKYDDGRSVDAETAEAAAYIRNMYYEV